MNKAHNKSRHKCVLELYLLLPLAGGQCFHFSFVLFPLLRRPRFLFLFGAESYSPSEWKHRRRLEPAAPNSSSIYSSVRRRRRGAATRQSRAIASTKTNNCSPAGSTRLVVLLLLLALVKVALDVNTWPVTSHQLMPSPPPHCTACSGVRYAAPVKYNTNGMSAVCCWDKCVSFPLREWHRLASVTQSLTDFTVPALIYYQYYQR